MKAIVIEFEPLALPISDQYGRHLFGVWRLYVSPRVDKKKLLEVSRELTKALESGVGVEYAEFSD